MKRLLLLTLPALALAACVEKYEPPVQNPYDRPAVEQSSSPDSGQNSGSASSAETQVEWKSVVLADRTFERAIGVTGQEWLNAIGAVKITGNVSQARLVVHLERGAEDDGRGWSALGAYFAPVAQGEGFDYPDESVYGTRLHFIDAEWRGDCFRHVAPSSSFGVIKEHSNDLTVDFSAVAMTKDDKGCETGQKTVNMLDIVNDTGLYLGFMPSDGRYRAVITLEYVGEVTVAPF